MSHAAHATLQVEFSISKHTKAAQQTARLVHQLALASLTAEVASSGGAGAGLGAAGVEEEMTNVNLGSKAMADGGGEMELNAGVMQADFHVAAGPEGGGTRPGRKLAIHQLVAGEAVEGMMCVVVGKESAASNGMYKCMVGDPSGTVVALYTQSVRQGARVFGRGRGTILCGSGHVVCAQGRLLLLVTAAAVSAVRHKNLECKRQDEGYVYVYVSISIYLSIDIIYIYIYIYIYMRTHI